MFNTVAISYHNEMLKAQMHTITLTGKDFNATVTLLNIGSPAKLSHACHIHFHVRECSQEHRPGSDREAGAVVSVFKGHSTSSAMANREPYEAGQEDHDRARADADNCRSSPGRLNTKQQGTGCDPAQPPGSLELLVMWFCVVWFYFTHACFACM